MLALLLGIVSAEQCDSAGYPRIVIGCWQLLEREHDQSQAVATLGAYVEAGYTAFDTADIYGPSEEILGKLRQAVSAPPRFFTKYVTKDSSLQEARRVNAKSRAALGAVPEMVQLHSRTLTLTPTPILTLTPTLALTLTPTLALTLTPNLPQTLALTLPSP